MCAASAADVRWDGSINADLLMFFSTSLSSWVLKNGVGEVALHRVLSGEIIADGLWKAEEVPIIIPSRLSDDTAKRVLDRRCRQLLQFFDDAISIWSRPSAPHTIMLQVRLSRAE